MHGATCGTIRRSVGELLLTGAVGRYYLPVECGRGVASEVLLRHLSQHPVEAVRTSRCQNLSPSRPLPPPDGDATSGSR
eukprot:3763235-Pyramimonas_sp.AAC.2